MKSISLPTFLAVATLGMSCPSPAFAADDPVATTPEARAKFIEQFRRSGLNTTPGDAMMLRILVRAHGSKRGVEVGTATGFGAINMGLAFEANGGTLQTVDIDPDMVKAARENIRRTGLEKTVTVIEGDALKVLPGLEGEYDFVFIDALKPDYLKYFKALEPKLKPGSVIVADNVIRSANAMRDFLDLMESSPDYEMVTIRASEEKGDGMAIIYKLR
jgi:predicted O-methyltransferase YrrM